jgi:hypothetical protein
MSGKDNSMLDYAFSGYQVAQFWADKRYFFLENKTEDGNTYIHTAQKIAEYSLGKIVRIQILS